MDGREEPAESGLAQAAGHPGKTAGESTSDSSWSESVRRYEENLDLDWEARVLRERRGARIEPEWNDDDDVQEEAG